ncbi:MAG: hypothetical protein K9M57_10325 [Phycisphaerae bacterium]|nr:hypothetical protein [Phycisphaerae bacterium]
MTPLTNPDGTKWPGVTGQFIPYTPGAQWMDGKPVELDGKTWDLAFELTTNEPGYQDDPIPGDLNFNGKVDLVDFSIFALHWLEGTIP